MQINSNFHANIHPDWNSFCNSGSRATIDICAGKNHVKGFFYLSIFSRPGCCFPVKRSQSTLYLFRLNLDLMGSWTSPHPSHLKLISITSDILPMLLLHFISLSAFLSFPEPSTEIIGAPDLYIESGSTINLTCVILYSPEPPAYIFWNHNNAVSRETILLIKRPAQLDNQVHAHIIFGDK